jgi:hypothetical protein
MSRDYGVLLQDKGMDLRGMYIIDPKGVVQQVTINNIAVGRSVLEALRLVEAFKVAADKGVLCPANWKTGESTLNETNEDEQHNTIREMGELQIKDLDNNTSLSFNLAMPAHIKAKHRKTTSAPAINTTTHPPAIRTTTNITTSNSKSNSATHSANNRVTLEFSDPLTGPQGRENSNEFVSVTEVATERRSGNASPTGVQKGLEALKRMSSGWATPLRSPGLNEPSPSREMTAQSATGTPTRTGYFD